MRMLNASTMEVDSHEDAVAELLAQLDLPNRGMKHAVGIITCSYDFIEAGTIEAISRALPFPIAGCTTLTNAENRQEGTMLLCLTVLTADDCQFSVAASPSVYGVLDDVCAETWQGLLKELDEPPKMAIVFAPMTKGFGGEEILTALDAAAGGVPLFGTMASDLDTAAYKDSHTICNGAALRDSVVLVGISGNARPTFVVAATSDQNLRRQQAVITAAHGCILEEINDMRARDYFDSIGFLQGSGPEALSSVPLMVNYQDGTEMVARAIYSLEEDGSGVCGGAMPVGGTISVGRLDVDVILQTARQSVEKLLAREGAAGLLLFPCLGRNMALGADLFLEIEAVREAVGDKLPWHLAYSAGEICPMPRSGGELVNRFHNFTFIGCAL